MLVNHIRIAFRSLLRYRYFTAINLIGFALGLSCCIFILLWITDEIKFDRFHPKGDALYRVMENQYYSGGETQTTNTTSALLALSLKDEIPEIALASQITWEIEELLTTNKESHKLKGRYVTPDFLEMFNYPFKRGNSKSALAKTSGIILTEKASQLYFGNENPLGKLILINNEREYEVTGVLQDVPKESSVQFQYLLHFDDWLKRNEWARTWKNNGPRAFVTLNKGISQEAAEAKIKNFVKNKLPNANIELFLQPYSEMYLYSDFKNGKQNGGRIDYVRSFSLVAFVVLIIACINFMNLSTARSLSRAKEIGIRKVNGAGRKTLILQFMAEAVLLSFIGLLMALLLVELLLPLFRTITEKDIAMDYNPAFLGIITGVTLLTGIISGSYPAFFLSSFNIINTLKGNLKFDTSSISMRKALVVFQFSMTIGLIICTLVVYRQMEYIKFKNLGFDRENLLLIPVEGDLAKKLDAVSTEAQKLEGIKSLTVSTTSPLVGGDNTIAVQWPGKLPDDNISFTQMGVGYNYLKTMGISLLDGRDFSPTFPSDSAAYIVNEETVRRMRLTDPIGQTIAFWGTQGKIIGVTKDYHVSSLHTAIEPVILHLHPQWANTLIVRIEGRKTTQSINELKKLSEQFNPQYPFTYNFVEETFEKQYHGETTVGTLANYFSLMAICISCLGLLGLIMFTAEQKTKEIGIRKILGATVRHILFLLSSDLILLVIIAFIISAPLAGYLMNNWLLGFAYRIQVDWKVFLISGIISASIAIVTVTLQALKAATANPVKSLRNE